MAPIIPITDSGGLTNYEVNKVKLRVISRGIQVNENPFLHVGAAPFGSALGRFYLNGQQISCTNLR